MLARYFYYQMLIATKTNRKGEKGYFSTLTCLLKKLSDFFGGQSSNTMQPLFLSTLWDFWQITSLPRAPLSLLLNGDKHLGIKQDKVYGSPLKIKHCINIRKEDIFMIY